MKHHCTLGWNRTNVTRLRVWSISPLLRRHVVGVVGFEPTKPYGNRFTVCPNSPTLTHSRGRKGGIRTPELLRGQIYSLLPLTTRPPSDMCTRLESNQRHLVKSQRHIPFATSAICPVFYVINWTMLLFLTTGTVANILSDPSGNRTQNPHIKSVVLYQLS